MAQQLPHHHLHKSFPAQMPLINQHGMRINSKALNDTQQCWLMLARSPAFDCKFHKSVKNSILLFATYYNKLDVTSRTMLRMASE